MVGDIAQIRYEVRVGVSRSGQSGPGQKRMIGQVVDCPRGSLLPQVTLGIQFVQFHFVVVPQVLHIHYFL